MSKLKSRIVNVIETRQGDKIEYFTLEGVLIGGFRGGDRIKSVVEKPKKKTSKGGIIKSPTPHEVKREKAREIENMKTPEGRLANLKKNVA